MGRNFIGPKELLKIEKFFPVFVPEDIPKIPFSENLLKKIRKDYILIFGVPKDKFGSILTLNRMREIFGLDPKKSEPCFYNQDWYVKEKFASQKTLNFTWYLIKKTVDKNTRGKDPNILLKKLKKGEDFPSAVLCAFTFFAYYLLYQGGILWEKDFIWCSDKDTNGDRIYVARYKDPKKINKNGFNIHRYLSLRNCYGFVPEKV